MAQQDVLHLFVYGSLRSGFKSAAYDYISRYFELVSEAVVRGKLYDLGSYPAAVPFSGEGYIKGELYLAKNEDEFYWAIAQLDDYEGVTVEQGETALYRRELAEIKQGTSSQPAWIYWYNGDVSGMPEIASGDIMDFLHKK